MAGQPKNMDNDLPYPGQEELVNYPDQTLQADPNAPPQVVPPPSTGADPWATPPADGNWEAWFRANTKGQLSPAQLIQLEATLAKHGIKVLRNAAGVAGKITLPNGQIVDVIQAAGAGGTNFQWLTDAGDESGAAGGNANVPDMDWFEANLPGPDPYTAMGRPDDLRYEALGRPEGLQQPYTPGTFAAPSFDELQTDPGYMARLNAGVQGRERMAAARGTILSGGHGKAIERYAQEFGGNEYANLHNRRFGEFQANEALKLGGRQVNESAYQDDVARGLSQYQVRDQAFRDDQNTGFNQYQTRYRTYRDAIGDRFRLAELGANTTMAGRP